jgi:hypothetical protein
LGCQPALQTLSQILALTALIALVGRIAIAVGLLADVVEATIMTALVTAFTMAVMTIHISTAPTATDTIIITGIVIIGTATN